MPNDTSGLPTRRPGQYKREHEGIDPRAIVQLAHMDRGSHNETELKEEAIWLCMQHFTAKQQTFEEMMEKFE